MKILVCLILWITFFQGNLTLDHGSGHEEVIFKPRGKSAKEVVSKVMEICNHVVCSSNQVCEIYEYQGNSYPICHAKELLHPLASACSIVNVCLNGGRCLGDRCECLPGVHGVLCETNFTMCDPATNPCKDNQLCVTVSGGGARTVALVGTMTKAIQTSSTTAVEKSVNRSGASITTTVSDPLASVEDACLENRCHGSHCRCVPSCKHERGYYCVSDLGYIGQYCEIAPPTLECAAVGISVGVSMKFVEEYEGPLTSSTLFVSASANEDSPSSNCVAIRRGNSLVVNIPVPFTTCGNLVASESTEELVYSSTLWVNYHENQTYDMPKPVLDFNCTYETEFIVSTKLKPVVDTVLPSLSAMVYGKVSASLCKVSVCDAECPGHLTITKGATYTVAEIVHLGLTVSSGNEQSAFLTEVEEAFLSCSNDDNENGKIILIKGCQDGNDLYARIGRRNNLSACMSFRVPKMSGCSVVYIHFKVSWCLESNIQNIDCPSGRIYRKCVRGIQKRSMVNNLHTEHHVFGPIEVVKSWKEMSLKYPDNSIAVVDTELLQDVKDPVNNSNTDHWHWYIVIGCGIGLLTVILLSSVTVFSFKKSC